METKPLKLLLVNSYKMSIDNKVAKAIIIGTISLDSLVTNPNFEARDFANPHMYFEKLTYDREYNNSGLVYGG